MSKQMSCSQVVGRAIRKFGLPAVRAAVEMAVELGQAETPQRTRITKNKVVDSKQAGIVVSTTGSGS